MRINVATILKNRTDLDTSFVAFAIGRDFPGPLDGLVQVLTLDDVIPGQLLLGFGEWSIGDDRGGTLHADSGGAGGGLERVIAYQHAFLTGLLHHSGVRPLQVFDFLGRRSAGHLLRIDEHDVAHCRVSSVTVPLPDGRGSV
jgi:hypothetical protein